MTAPQIPNIGDVIGPAIDAMIAKRPATAPHLTTGLPTSRWGNVVEGWRAQFEAARGRLTDEAIAARAALATGQALRELAHSEAELATHGELKSVGEVVLERKVVHYVRGSAAETVQASDATDQATAITLLNANAAAMNIHRISVWNSATGVGSHLAPDVVVWTGVGGSPSADDLANAANLQFSLANNHLLSTAAHLDIDIGSYIPLSAVPTASNEYQDGFGPGDPYSRLTDASQQQLLRVINAVKRMLVAHVALESRAGVIRPGHPFEIRGDSAATPPISSTRYVARQHVAVLTGAQSVTVPIEARDTGPSSAIPVFLPARAVTPISPEPFFDDSVTNPTNRYSVSDEAMAAGTPLKLTPTSIAAAGGSLGQSDASIRRAFRAAWPGRDAASVTAILAGALRFGAARALVREDRLRGNTLLFCVDESWAQSDTWLSDIEQKIRAANLGFGLKLSLEPVLNQVVRVETTVMLRSSAYLTASDQITEAVRRALEQYFNERDDWNGWRLNAIKGIVSRADRRILKCSTVVVRNANGLVLPEPLLGEPAAGAEHYSLTHGWLVDNSVSCSFVGPG